MAIAQHSLEKTGFVDVDGGKVHYRVYEPHAQDKSSKTPLLFIHGGPGACHALMYDCLGELANDRTSIFYDQLGSYFSPAEMSDDLLRIERFSDEIGHLLKALNHDRAILLGHSWGGAVATHFSLHNPEKVAGLILSCPLLSTETWLSDCRELLGKLLPEIQQTIISCEAEGKTDSDAYMEAERVFSSHYFYRPKMVVGALPKHRTKTNRHIYVTMWGPSEFSCTGTLRDLNLMPRMSELSMPVHIICGEHDTSRPETMEKVRACVPEAALDVLNGCSHLPFVEDSEKYIKSIRSFLDRVN